MSIIHKTRHNLNICSSSRFRTKKTSAVASIVAIDEKHMTERISTIDVRQPIGNLLNFVALRNDEFIIERKGKTSQHW